MHIQANKRRTLTNAGLIGIGLVLLGVGIFGLLKQHKVTTGTAAPINVEEVITREIPEPEEKVIAEEDFPVVPADMPRSIEMPSINAKGFIQKVAIDSTNAVAVPSNIFLAGWYVNSVKPGQDGVSLVVGHVQGQYKEGVFKNIAKLKAGDVVSVVYGDGTKKDFTVQIVADFSTEEAGTKMLQPVNGIQKQLNLITCAGIYNKATKQYEKRTLVVAKANF